MSDLITIGIAFAIAPISIGYCLGYYAALSKGRAEGWLEHYEKCITQDRARRERNGQFRAREIAK